MYKLCISTFKPTRVKRSRKWSRKWKMEYTVPKECEHLEKLQDIYQRIQRWNCLVKHESLLWTVLHRVSTSVLQVQRCTNPQDCFDGSVIVPLCVCAVCPWPHWALIHTEGPQDITVIDNANRWGHYLYQYLNELLCSLWLFAFFS